MSKKLLSIVVGAIAAVSASSAMAAEGTNEIDLTPLTSSISFANVSTAILGIAVTVAGLYALYAGVKHVLRMVRSA